jgi:hypothetical protein
MNRELCLVICFFVGVLVFYLLKQSCGCKSTVEGNVVGSSSAGPRDGVQVEVVAGAPEDVYPANAPVNSGYEFSEEYKGKGKGKEVPKKCTDSSLEYWQMNCKKYYTSNTKKWDTIRKTHNELIRQQKKNKMNIMIKNCKNQWCDKACFFTYSDDNCDSACDDNCAYPEKCRPDKMDRCKNEGNDNLNPIS